MPVPVPPLPAQPLSTVIELSYTWQSLPKYSELLPLCARLVSVCQVTLPLAATLDATKLSKVPPSKLVSSGFFCSLQQLNCGAYSHRLVARLHFASLQSLSGQALSSQQLPGLVSAMHLPALQTATWQDLTVILPWHWLSEVQMPLVSAVSLVSLPASITVGSSAMRSAPPTSGTSVASPCWSSTPGTSCSPVSVTLVAGVGVELQLATSQSSDASNARREKTSRLARRAVNDNGSMIPPGDRRCPQKASRSIIATPRQRGNAMACRNANNVAG